MIVNLKKGEQTIAVGGRAIVHVTDIPTYGQAMSALTDAEKQLRMLQCEDNEGKSEEYKNLSAWISEQHKELDTYNSGLPTFDYSILLKNITYLVKKQDIKVRDLESMLGVSAGYLSRASADSNDKQPDKAGKKLSIDIVWKIARIFDVGVNELVHIDLENPNSDAAYLAKFFSNVQQKTRDHLLDWDVVNSAQVGKNDIISSIPGISENNVALTYEPEHLSDKFSILGKNCYICRYEGTAEYGSYIVIIPYDIDNKRFYDSFFVDENMHMGVQEPETICFSCNEGAEAINETLKELESLISRGLYGVTVKKSVRHRIDNFMSDDEELPFA